MVRCLFILLVVFGLNACTLIEDIVMSMPISKTSECCYMNGTKDTIFFTCKRQRTKKMEIAITNQGSNDRLFFGIHSSGTEMQFH